MTHEKTCITKVDKVIVWLKNMIVMKSPDFRFVFDRTKKATKKKASSVYSVVTFERKRKFLSTGIRLYSGQWDDVKMVVGRRDAKELNEILISMRIKFLEFLKDLEKDGKQFSFYELDAFIEKKSVDDDFVSFVAKRIEERNDITMSTKKQHKTLLASLNEYGKIRSFSSLTSQNIIGYYDFVLSKKVSKPTAYNYIKRIKVYIHDAMRIGLLEKDPTSGFKFERGASTRRKYLTEDELEKMKNAVLINDSLMRVRDLFLFQCYTGLAYADFAKFDFKNDVQQRNGKYVVVDRRQKTGEDFYLVILPPALEILKKYGYDLPVITNQNYNLFLKAIAQSCGISKSVTSHMARHTFAVFALNNGVPIEVLAKMMGHTDIKTTQIYAKVLNKEVEKGFELLESKL